MHEFWTQPELDIKTEQLNDDAYARALDKLGETKMSLLISKICIEMLKEHSLKLRITHFDTTSKSVQGAYDAVQSEKIVGRQ